ncbi:MAG: 30S ribosomal protein S15 [Planctomycetota bacterium]|nr:MAG: 30S ribosomal protein S15 [Planctomycetota bacterium]
MTTNTVGKADIIGDYQQHERDCGSTDVQIALLTNRIRGLTEHLKLHKKDNHTRRGLLTLVGRRGRLLVYLKRIDPVRYQQLIERLGIRGIRTNV